jgi:hypothetical protein
MQKQYHEMIEAKASAKTIRPVANIKPNQRKALEHLYPTA